MALYKVIKSSKGVACAYHRILAYGMNYIDNTIGINVASYCDENYRDAEKKTGQSMIIDNTGITLPIVDEDFTRETLYKRLVSEVELFKDSESI